MIVLEITKPPNAVDRQYASAIYYLQLNMQLYIQLFIYIYMDYHNWP